MSWAAMGPALVVRARRVSPIGLEIDASASRVVLLTLATFSSTFFREEEVRSEQCQNFHPLDA